VNAITNAHIFGDAIGATSGELILDLTGGEPLQFQSHLNKSVYIEKGLSVNSISLVDALVKFGLESCDLLKLDCEGTEYQILFGTPRSALKRVQRIVMEYHNNLTPYTHNDLTSFLQERGFEVETFPNPVHSHLGFLRALQKR
jgi:FkbM family methyltransferase